MECAGAETEKRTRSRTGPGPFLPLALSLGAGITFWLLAFAVLGNHPGVFRRQVAESPRLMHITLASPRVPAGRIQPRSILAKQVESRSLGAPERAMPEQTFQADPGIPDRSPASEDTPAGTRQPESARPDEGRYPGHAESPAYAGVTSPVQGPQDISRDHPGSEISDSTPETLSRQALDEAIRTRLVYPALARKRGIAGVCTWRVDILPDGRLKTLQLIESSGSSSLDEAAGSALRLSFPLPAHIGSPVSLDYRITFKIK